MAKFTETLTGGHIEMIGEQPVFFAGKEGC